VALVSVALLGLWGDALTYGTALLVFGYALSLGDNDARVDWIAPLVALALLTIVEFGSWSLELRDGAEERPLARLPAVSVLLVAGVAASSVILAVGAVRLEGGLVFWVLGAAAALALLAMVSRVRDTQPK
jgi:hypothetical protein